MLAREATMTRAATVSTAADRERHDGVARSAPILPVAAGCSGLLWPPPISAMGVAAVDGLCGYGRRRNVEAA